jgi:hypothetical protein
MFSFTDPGRAEKVSGNFNRLLKMTPAAGMRLVCGEPTQEE